MEASQDETPVADWINIDESELSDDAVACLYQEAREYVDDLDDYFGKQAI